MLLGWNNMCIQSIYNLPIIKVEFCLPFADLMIHFNSMKQIFDPDLKKYICRGEYVLKIVNAAWRLREGHNILFSCDYSLEEDMIKTLDKYLQKRRIILCEDVSEFDFRITFDNGAILETLFFVLDVDDPVKWLIYKPDGSTYFHEILHAKPERGRKGDSHQISG
jgi:hypothetical protein